jgi:hypothetical protein
MGGINLQGSQYEKIAKDTKRRSQEPESRSQEDLRSMHALGGEMGVISNQC